MDQLRIINYSYLVLAIVGTCTNILAFVVFSTKKYENTIFSTYFRVLLVVDTTALIFFSSNRQIYEL